MLSGAHLAPHSFPAKDWREFSLRTGKESFANGNFLEAVEELDVGHGRVVAGAIAAFQDAEIATRAGLKPRADFGKQLPDDFFVSQTCEREAPGVYGVVLGERDQGLGHAPEFLCLRQRGFDQFMPEQSVGQRLQGCFAV